MNQLGIRFFIFIFFISIAPLLYSHNLEDNRMKWWREARFGMFIHWGVYSVYGNVYDGSDVNGDKIHYNEVLSGWPSEWIMSRAKIPRKIYREAAKEFDAKDYDPKKWVQIAKDAGMKYIVITTKHHDGFCLFDSQYTDWNAVDASAAKRDLLDDLVKETKAAGLKIGFYYSQNLDWMHEGGMGEIPELNGELYPIEKVNTYIDNLVIPQIKELISKYDFDIFWFDGEYAANTNAEISQKILDVLKNSSVGDHIIINNRLYAGFEGDFSTPESDTPDIPYNGYDDTRDWEACASLNNSWGYENTSAVDWKTPLYTISRILELASKGGNFLLNVGPDKHGNIPEGAVNTLEEVGIWMAKYGKSIYGTEKNELLNPFEYGYVTQKTDENGNFHWYLHVPAAYWREGKIYLTGIKELPQSATYLINGQDVEIQHIDNDLVISLAEGNSDFYYSVIDLNFSKLPEQNFKPQKRNNQIRLTPYQATTYGIRKDYSSYAFKEWYSLDFRAKFILFLEPGVYSIQAEYAAINDGELYFNIAGQNCTGYYKKTTEWIRNEEWFPYITEDLRGAVFTIYKPGIYPLIISRNAEIPNHYNLINIRNFVLKLSTDSANNSIENQGLAVYPNPVKEGYFYYNSGKTQTVNIYDLQGCVRKTFAGGYNIRVDMRDLNSGIYIVKGVNERESCRLIIQN